MVGHTEELRACWRRFRPSGPASYLPGLSGGVDGRAAGNVTCCVTETTPSGTLLVDFSRYRMRFETPRSRPPGRGCVQLRHLLSHNDGLSDDLAALPASDRPSRDPRR